MMDELMNSWYNLLNGNITVSSATVPVYKWDAPATETGNYIVIRPESTTDGSFNNQFHFVGIVLLDICTVHRNNVSSAGAESIRNQIFDLVFPVKNANALPSQPNVQILNVKEDTTTYLYEDDGVSDKTLRLIVRYYHTLVKK